MKRYLINSLLLIILASTLIAVYLNGVYLPKKIKTLIIEKLEGYTQRKVSLEEVKFNIFKGLVVRNLAIYDGKEMLFSLEEGSCAFLIQPFFRKGIIIIPSIKLDSAVIYLEREKDGRLNLADLFDDQKSSSSRPRFKFIVFRIDIIDSSVEFKDNTFVDPFVSSLNNIDLAISLLPTASVAFNLKAEIPGTTHIKINSRGRYNFAKKDFSASLAVNDFSPQKFYPYYQNAGILVDSGLIDVDSELKFKDGIFNVDLRAESEDVSVSRDNLNFLLNGKVNSNIVYSLGQKKANYFATVNLIDSKIKGLEIIESVDDLKGTFRLNNNGISFQDLRAEAFGLPISARGALTNFAEPLLELNIVFDLDLNSAKSILNENFNIKIPFGIEGKSRLNLKLKKELSLQISPEIDAELNILDATINSDKIKAPIEEINGKINFTQNSCSWSELAFNFFDEVYKTSGTLNDFQNPVVKLELASKDLSINSQLTFKDNIIDFSDLKGKLADSEFSVIGRINTDSLNADVSGNLALDLKDVKRIRKTSRKQLDNLNLKGLVIAKFSLQGELDDFSSLNVKAEISSPSVSLLNLKSDIVTIHYLQSGGVGFIPLLEMKICDGSVNASAEINFKDKNLPYWLDADIKSVKLNTATKDGDITGLVDGWVKLRGGSNDLSKLTGEGKLTMKDGKFWYLNLHEGMGAILLTKDFSNLIFYEGSFTFTVKDKYLYTEDLFMKSKYAELKGKAKIGFDSSIDAAVDVIILEEMLPEGKGFKDIATSIIGFSEKFGTIYVAGTLKEPKYKFKTAVGKIFKAIKDAIFR